MRNPIFKQVLMVLLMLAGTFTISKSQQPSKIESSAKKVTVFTIGDSTMANKKAAVAPETGWCQAFPAFVDQSVEIKNRAVNGRSTKSFITEGRWKAVLDSLNPGDYVFIQFGHNDQKIQQLISLDNSLAKHIKTKN